MIFETCGGIGFEGRKCCAPRKTPQNPLSNYMKKRHEFKQQQRIQYLENKAKTGGLSTAERFELAAQKIDSAISKNDYDPVIYASGSKFCCTV